MNKVQNMKRYHYGRVYRKNKNGLEKIGEMACYVSTSSKGISDLPNLFQFQNFLSTCSCDLYTVDFRNRNKFIHGKINTFLDPAVF